jgi:hypothetical protein
MKTYTLDELSEKLNWHKSALKVILRKMNIDPDEPIEDEDCAAVAEKLRKAWPVGV